MIFLFTFWSKYLSKAGNLKRFVLLGFEVLVPLFRFKPKNMYNCSNIKKKVVNQNIAYNNKISRIKKERWHTCMHAHTHAYTTHTLTDRDT